MLNNRILMVLPPYRPVVYNLGENKDAGTDTPRIRKH